MSVCLYDNIRPHPKAMAKASLGAGASAVATVRLLR